MEQTPGSELKVFVIVRSSSIGDLSARINDLFDVKHQKTCDILSEKARKRLTPLAKKSVASTV